MNYNTARFGGPEPQLFSYNEFLTELRVCHKTQCQGAQAEAITNQTWHDLRLVVAHDPVAAAEQTGRRNARIDALIDQTNAWGDKLGAQDLGETRRGRPLSDHGARAPLNHAVGGAHLSRILKIDLKSPVLRYHIDWKSTGPGGADGRQAAAGD